MTDLWVWQVHPTCKTQLVLVMKKSLHFFFVCPNSHYPYKSLPAFFFPSNSFNSSENWLYEQCLTAATYTSHSLLITPYPPSQNHSMTFLWPWHLPLNAWSVWAAPISCSTSHLALWHHPVYSWCSTQPTLHMAQPLLTSSWSHLRSESPVKSLSIHRHCSHTFCRENLFTIQLHILQVNIQMQWHSSEGVTGNIYTNYASL